MARTNNLSNFLTDVADAIRTKKGSEELIAAEDFDTEIENLPSGGGADLSEYFVTSITQNKTTNTPINYIKKLPDLTIENNVTRISYLFPTDFYYTNDVTGEKSLPKVICGSNVTNMSYMYATASLDTNVTTIDLSGINTSNVANMANMFEARSKLKALDLSRINFSKIDTISYMFRNCSALQNINLSNLDGKAMTSNNNSMQSVFTNCSSIRKIDLSNFEPINQIDARSTFYSCTRLEELYLDKFDMVNKIKENYASNMFSSCGSQLTNGAVTKVYVKDEACQNWVLTASNGHPSNWTTDNVIIAGSEADLRNA